jgi:DNA-binding response OmpR family regulator
MHSPETGRHGFLVGYKNILDMRKISPADKKILIVEDEGDLCFLLELMLEKDHTTVDHVKSLAAARDFLKEENADLILLDNRLPDGLGLDFIPFVKDNYPNVRIVMISGKDRSAKDVAIESGADIFLPKPFTKDQLYQSVETLLN